MFWCPCMAINISVQCKGGLLSDIIMLTQCYYHRGTLLNSIQEVSSLQPMHRMLGCVQIFILFLNERI